MWRWLHEQAFSSLISLPLNPRRDEIDSLLFLLFFLCQTRCANFLHLSSQESERKSERIFTLPHPSSPCISLSTFNSELFWFSHFPFQHQHRFLSIVFIHCVSFAFHLFTVCLSIQVYLIGPLSYFLSDTFLSNLFSHSPFLTPLFSPLPPPFLFFPSLFPSILFLFSSIFYPLSFFLLTFATILHFSHSKNLLQNLILKTHSKT